MTIELPLGAVSTPDLFQLIAKRTKDGTALGNAGVMAMLAGGAGLIPAPGPAGGNALGLPPPALQRDRLEPPRTADRVRAAGPYGDRDPPFVPITQCQGLSIGAMSYHGRLWIGINADAALMDAGAVARAYRHAFTELAADRPAISALVRRGRPARRATALRVDAALSCPHRTRTDS